MALCPFYGPLPPMDLSCLYGALFNLYGPLSSLRPSILSTALYPLYDPLFLHQPSGLSTALCLLFSPYPLCDPLTPLWPPVPSEKQQNKQNDLLVLRNVLQNMFRQSSKVYRDLFRISDNRDYRYNHDYHSSEILSDNRKIAIIALAKKVATIAIMIIAIVTSNKKR
jgi:hypothetical protein